VLPASACEAAAGWLVVEDESLVAMMVEDALAEIGVKVAGIATRVETALALIRNAPPAGAILDVNLAGEFVYPVAEALAALGIPFVFLTGYGEEGVRGDFAARPVVQKPFVPDQIQSAIGRARLAHR
jgi:CheY-like chemotaxis protein